MSVSLSPYAPSDGRTEELPDYFQDFGRTGQLRTTSDLAACLIPLLTALGWSGPRRALAEALPHFTDTFHIDHMRGVLGRLNFITRPQSLKLGDLDPRLLPCLFVPLQGTAKVVLARDRDSVTVFDGGTSQEKDIHDVELPGTAYFVAPADASPAGAGQALRQDGWWQSVAGRFRLLLLQMVAITFVTSLLALAVPLFIMSIYDRVIPAQSTGVLPLLAVGVLIALTADLLLRLIRTRILAHLGARIDVLVGSAVFQQILYLPIAMTERAAMGTQLSRLKQFEAIREFFTGPLAGVVLELPFIVVFIAAIAIIAGPLAWVPVILTGVFAIAAIILMPFLRRAVNEAAETRARRQNFLVETLTKLRTVKSCVAEDCWSARHRDLSARLAFANLRSSRMSAIVQTMAQSLMLGGGIASITLGTMQVLNQTMTMGALIAAMALTWRILAPLQVGFLSVTRLEQILLSLRQINQLMKLRLERPPAGGVHRYRSLKGQVTFQRVSLRYTPTAEPALLGVGLAVETGKLVAITGSSGSGKSTMLKLVAGLYQPQAGAVLIDGLDIRQIDAGELRESVAYVPQVCHLFYGTIAQNLRLANPTATTSDLTQAAHEAGLTNDILLLPDGFETRITDRLQQQLSRGFKQRLMLARAYAKRSSVYLLDEPASNLDAEGDAALRRKLQQLRGHATVLMVTHRPSHIRLADHVVVLDAGQIVAAGRPDELLPRGPEE